MIQFHATTICAVRRGMDDVAIGGDGQVTMGETAIMKNGAVKVKKIFNDKKLVEHGGNLKRAAVDLARVWRSDQGMRNLEALMIVADKDQMLIISGNGEVIAPDQDFVAIGSGGNYAYSAANALFNHTDMCAEDVVRESLKIASSI